MKIFCTRCGEQKEDKRHFCIICGYRDPHVNSECIRAAEPKLVQANKDFMSVLKTLK